MFDYKDISVFDSIEEAANRSPDRLAIDASTEALTYSELTTASRRVAAYFAKKALAPSEIVGVYMHSGCHWAIAVLGTLAGGYAYVPLDPDFPEEHNLNILAKVAPKVVVKSRSIEMKANVAANCMLIDIEDILEDLSLALGEGLPQVAPASIASIIFTSGSTGEPRGVVQTHKTIVHGAYCRSVLQGISSDDRMTWFYSPSVKGTEYCFFVALLNGATLLPRKIGAKHDDQLVDWLNEKGVTVYHSVASFFRYVASSVQAGNASIPDCLRLVILGGERVLKQDVDLFSQSFPETCMLFTALGATETGTICHLPFERLKALDEPVVPIGFPVEGCDVLIVDKDRNPLNVGEEGHILVRSEYISPGYWNEETDAFQPVPGDPDKIEYLSGDLGVLGEDGLLRHRGRSDSRVKVNGYLVNLGVVEAALLNYPQVEDCVVKTQNLSEQGNQLLAFVLNENQAVTDNELHTWLNQKLPSQMVPTRYFILKAWPRLPNGKIDRGQLTLENYGSAVQAQEPEAVNATPLEVKISEAWKHVLNRDNVDMDASFISQGGGSMAFLALSLEFKKMGYANVGLASLIQNSTVRKQAGLLASLEEESEPEVALINPLWTESSGPNHFLVPPWGGGKLVFENFISHTENLANFYSLELLGIETDSIPYDSLEASMQALAKKLISENLTERYCFMGYSSGGLLAIELAQCVKDLGKEVGSVILIDTLHPDVYNPHSLDSPWAFQTDNLKLRQIRKHKKVLRMLPMHRKGAYLLNRLNNKYRHLMGKERDSEDGKHSTQELIKNKALFFSKYTNRKYTIDLQLIKATGLDKVERWLDDTLGWGDYIDGQIDLHSISAYHSEILLPEVAPQLAAKYLEITHLKG